MADIEKIVQKSTIEFKHELSRKEAKEMLRHVSFVLRADVSYVFTDHGNFIPEASGMPTEDEGSFRVEGSIRKKDDFRASDKFGTEPSGRDYQKAESLRFNLVRGWDEADYRPEVLKLWEDTRKAVESYFQQKLNDGDHSA